jgi:hypothetical protein
MAVLGRRARAKDRALIETLAADPISDIGIAAKATLARLAAPAATGANPA